MADLSRPDLRALFRTNNRALVPADVFANRSEEWAAVRRGLAEVVAWRRSPEFDALGEEFARHGGEPSRRVLLGCLRQGLRLARDHDLSIPASCQKLLFLSWSVLAGRYSLVT